MTTINKIWLFSVFIWHSILCYEIMLIQNSNQFRIWIIFFSYDKRRNERRQNLNEMKIKFKKKLYYKKSLQYNQYACYVYFAACVYDEAYFESVWIVPLLFLCLHRDTSKFVYYIIFIQTNTIQRQFFRTNTTTWLDRCNMYNDCDAKVKASSS